MTIPEAQKPMFLDRLLHQMNIPFEGVALNPPRIDFLPEATQEQRDAANAILSQFGDAYIAGIHLAEQQLRRASSGTVLDRKPVSILRRKINRG